MLDELVSYIDAEGGMGVLFATEGCWIFCGTYLLCERNRPY